jgi:hypothetical protein
VNDDGNQFDQSTAGNAEAELDALLGRAVWPAPSPESTARLRARWRALRCRPERRVWTWSGVAAAAAAIVVAGWHLMVPFGDRTSRPTPLTSVIVRPDSPAADGPQGWREPTAIEVALVRHDVLPHPVADARPTPREAVETAIQSLLRGPDAEVAALAQAMARSAGPALLERELGDVLDKSYGLRRRAVVRLLCEVAGPRSLPLLWQMVADPDTRGPAYVALRRLADPADLAAFAQREAESARRRRSALVIPNSVDRHGALAIALFAAAAAATPQRTPGPSVDAATEALFAELSCRDADARVRAARALARQPGGAVTARLARMAEENVNRREALIALASSADPDARAFLRQAAGSPALAGPVRSALIQYRP